MAVTTRQFIVHLAKIQNRMDPAHLVIGRNYIIKAEFIEKLTLTLLNPTHHRSVFLTTLKKTESSFADQVNGRFAAESG